MERRLHHLVATRKFQPVSTGHVALHIIRVCTDRRCNRLIKQNVPISSYIVFAIHLKKLAIRTARPKFRLDSIQN